MGTAASGLWLLYPEFTGGKARIFFEDLCKVILTVESDGVSDLFYAERSFQNHGFRLA